MATLHKLEVCINITAISDTEETLVPNHKKDEGREQSLVVRSHPDTGDCDGQASAI